MYQEANRTELSLYPRVQAPLGQAWPMVSRAQCCESTILTLLCPGNHNCGQGTGTAVPRQGAAREERLGELQEKPGGGAQTQQPG